MKPLIGITTGEVINKDEPWASTIYGQKYSYSEAIVAAGGIPILIPIMPEAQLKSLYGRLDGIVFAGGNDLNPSLYGEEKDPLTVDVSDVRDKQETILMTWTLADNKPMFAICRGFQLFNVVLGGSLYQDIAKSLPESSNHELSSHQQDYTFIAHRLKLAPTSKFALISHSLQMDANTHHHQGIKQIAPELRAVAWAEDGIVEALEHPTKSFAIGVQCHPESLYKSDDRWATVFKAFVKASSPMKAPIKLFKFSKNRIKKTNKNTAK